MKQLVASILVFAIGLPQFANGQSLLDKGDRCYTESKYDSALYYYQSYIGDFNSESQDTYSVFNKMADIHNRIGNAKKASELANKVIAEAGSSEKVAKAYINLSNTEAIYESDFSSALEFVNKAIKMLEKDKLIGKALGQAYRSQGVTYYDLAQYHSAVDSYQKASEIFSDLDDGGKQTSLTLNNLANAYDRLGNYYLGLETHMTALNIKKEIYPQIHPEIAISLNNIGNSYHYLDQYEKALEYFNLSLEQRTELFGRNHRRVASVLNNIGNLYFDMADFENSKKIHQEALQIRKNIYHANHSILMYSYSNLARTYDALNIKDSAIYYLQSAITIHNENYDGPTDMLAAIYQNLGVHYQQQENFQMAGLYFSDALKFLKNKYGSKHASIASLFNAVGDSDMAQGRFWQAANDYQQGLKAVVAGFDIDSIGANPSSMEISDPGELIKLYKGKVNALYQIYEWSASSDKMKLAEILLKTLRSADSYIKEFRKEMVRREDLQNLGEQSIFLYDILIRVSHDLYQLTSDNIYLEEVFMAMEKSRSNSLFQQLTDIRAKVDGSIPDSLLASNNSLLKEINFYTSNNITDKLHESNMAYEKGLKSLSENFPEYYDLKYNYKFQSTEDVKSRLSINQAVIEYRLLDSTLYTIYIDVDTARIIKQVLPSGFTKMVDEYLDYLEDPTSSKDLRIKQIGTTLTAILYGSLPQQKRSKDHLTIIPDGLIASIPFEVLPLAEEDYLIRQFNIQYGYSVKTLFHEVMVKKVNKKESFAGFAPSYGMSDSAENMPEPYSARISALGPLFWNQPEVKSIKTIVGGDAYLGVDATENKFIYQAENYNILHLATHALTGENSASDGKLFFQSGGDIDHDGVLHSFEIYNLRLGAELVVLSMCNSGKGEYRLSEGILSLAHAFRFAGTSSVIMSHWSVDDKSSFEVMNYFYDELRNGHSKSQALRKAKLRFIDNAAPEKTHPFFWSPYTVIGKDHPIEMSSGLGKGIISVIVLSIIMAVMMLLVLIRKRKSRNILN